MQSIILFTRGSNVSSIDKRYQITGVACIALIFPTITLFLRMYVRHVLQKRFGKDDTLAIASLFLLSSLCALLIRICRLYGTGTQFTTFSSSVVELSRMIFICQILYTLTTVFTKFSIGFYFLRLTCNKFYRQVIYGTMVILAIFSTIYLFFIVFQCQPVNYLWRQHDLTNITGMCQSKKSLKNITYAHALMSFSVDWIFGILPTLFLWKLDINLKTKISVITVLSLSIFVSIATVFRIVEIHTLKSMTNLNEGVRLLKLSIIELAMALTTTNIATLRPLTQKLFPSKRRPIRLSLNIICGLNKNSSIYYSKEFADMLGLRVMPGIRTHVYSDSCLETNTVRSPVYSRWRDSETGLCSPTWSASWRGCNENEKSKKLNWYGHKFEGEKSTVSLGLGSIKNGSWVTKEDKNARIIKTIVVTRDVDTEER